MENQDKELLEEVIKRIESSNKDEVLEISREFNELKFVPSMYDLIPDWWFKDGERRHSFISRIFDKTRLLVSYREELWYHNVVHGRMSELEFEYWFNNCSLRYGYNKSTVDTYYHRRYVFEKLKWWEDDVFNKLIEKFPEINNNQE